MAGGINDQRGGKLPLRQLFRERLVSVIERQIGAVFPAICRRSAMRSTTITCLTPYTPLAPE